MKTQKLSIKYVKAKAHFKDYILRRLGDTSVHDVYSSFCESIMKKVPISTEMLSGLSILSASRVHKWRRKIPGASWLGGPGKLSNWVHGRDLASICEVKSYWERHSICAQSSIYIYIPTIREHTHSVCMYTHMQKYMCP